MQNISNVAKKYKKVYYSYGGYLNQKFNYKPIIKEKLWKNIKGQNITQKNFLMTLD